MSKSKEGREFFQFPLCLLNLPPNEGHGFNSAEQWLAHHIVSWQLVHGGEKYRKRDMKTYGEDHVSLRIRERAGEMEKRGELPEDYDPKDWRHRALVKATEVHSVTVHRAAGTVKEYERVSRHLRAFQEAVGDGEDFVRVRVRRDLIWDHLEPGKMSLREFRVIAAVYSKIGGEKPYTTCHFESEMRWRASGYKSEAAYDAASGAQRLAGAEEEAEVQPVTLDRSALPDPPEDSGYDSYSGSDKPEGFFRYDEAVTYRRQRGFDGPLTGEGGMFDVLATSAGALFRLHPQHFPEEGNPTTGHFDTRRVYRHGERVVFDWRRRLQVGTVEKVRKQSLDVRTEDGRTYPRLARSARAAPARFFEEAVKQAEAEAAAEERAAWPGLLTKDQLRYTAGKMLDTKWLFKYYDGRRNWYSHRLNSEEIAKLRTKGKRERIKRKRREAKARVEAKRATLKEQKYLDDLEAHEARLNAQLDDSADAEAEAQSADEEADGLREDDHRGKAQHAQEQRQQGQSEDAGDGAGEAEDLPPDVTESLSRLFTDEGSRPRGGRR
jgi:hypothetical protein